VERTRTHNLAVGSVCKLRAETLPTQPPRQLVETHPCGSNFIQSVFKTVQTRCIDSVLILIVQWSIGVYSRKWLDSLEVVNKDTDKEAHVPTSVFIIADCWWIYYRSICGIAILNNIVIWAILLSWFVIIWYRDSGYQVYRRNRQHRPSLDT